MNDIFDPDPHSDQGSGAPPEGSTGSPDGPSRRRWLIAGAAASGLALGGVGLVQLATASDGDSVSVRTAAVGATAPDGSGTTDDPGAATDTPADGDESGGDGPFAGWPELDEAFGAYDECIEQQVGDLLPGWDDLGDEFGEWAEAIEVDVPWLGGSVLVESGEGLPTWFDFGEGDGSVTVTRSDGTISVETSGDVTEVDGSEFLDEVIDGDVLEALPALPGFDEETVAALDAAHEACADLLPADIEFGEFDLGDFSFGELDLGDFDFGEFDLGELDLSELPFDVSEIDLGELDLDAELGELRTRLDELGIDLGQFGIDSDELDAMLDQLTSIGD